VIDRVSCRISLLTYSDILRIGAKQLDALDCFGTECPGGDLSVERIRNLLQQGVSLTQNGAAGKLIGGDCPWISRGLDTARQSYQPAVGTARFRVDADGARTESE
jgi:hypothetical protein